MTASQPFRLPAAGRIDRSQPVTFHFNGRTLQGYGGDTIASALLANGIRIVNRSFKLHRPRGILSAGVEEPNGLFAVDAGAGLIPLVRATATPLLAGMRVESQSGFPGIGFDLLRMLDYTRPLWPAGFYNKTFKWPGWHTYEGAIRRAAGLGRLPGGDNPVRYAHRNAYCDVLVVGGGPAGLAAARAAARRGEGVLLVEQQTEPGGSLLHDDWFIDGQPSSDWRDEVLAELKAATNVRRLWNATAAGYYDHNVLTIHDRQAALRRDQPLEVFWKVRAREVMLATGAIEQPLMFGNNDLPGVMLAGAMHQYATRYAVACGHKVVGLVNNDLGWQSLFALHDADVPVVAVVDERAAPRDDLVTAAGERDIAVHAGCRPLRARGSRAVTGLVFEDRRGRPQRIACDGIAMSGGLNPTGHLYSQAGGRLRWDTDLACFVPDTCRQQVRVVGAAAGRFARPDEYNIARRRPAPDRTSRQWVDYLHDVTVADLELAVRENFVSVEHLKRYTTTGMSVDQGKTSNLNALSALGLLTDRGPGEVGTTTFRPNFMPVTMGAIAGSRHGELYAPARRLPAHDWHASQGAVFEDFGGWRRPAWYGADRAAAIREEVRTVRERVGLFDGSALGKIEVKGPDAAEFLDRMYLNTVPTLKNGRVRYGLMLNENGIVIDDGVYARLADDHFLVNTTAGNADRITAWLDEWHQCEWPELRIVLAPVTTQWAVATLAGPHARNVLQGLPGIGDLSTEAFPHMHISEGRFDDDTPYRIQRVSYSGELGYELSVPAVRGAYFMETLIEQGELHGIGLFGIEALLVLRLEKGLLHVGADTDGTTNPFDIGFGRIVENKQRDFVGARSLQRPNDRRTDRRQLVGFGLPKGMEPVRAGAHFVTGEDGRDGNRRRSEGFVTSACLSPTLGRPIGLGLLERGFARRGETVRIFDEGCETTARIVDPCFYDPNGERMRG
jgi:sarcosine oxidase subunit alpha